MMDTDTITRPDGSVLRRRWLFRYSGNQSEADRLTGADGRKGDPIISRYNEKVCIVVRPLTLAEADLDETGPMSVVRFEDGYEGDAFDDELTRAGGFGSW